MRRVGINVGPILINSGKVRLPKVSAAQWDKTTVFLTAQMIKSRVVDKQQMLKEIEKSAGKKRFEKFRRELEIQLKKIK